MIVAGFGFRRAATVESLADALIAAERAQGCRAERIATVADKATSDSFAGFATKTGLPVSAVSSDALVGQDTRTRSEASEAARATGSVAEAAALAAAGPGARLLGARVISPDRHATCALAEGDPA
ncbi:cobalamin biosynthesis protein [Litorisediminicola beolgyonensis]|uniref:Cobalamin biosynthesis protein n=1 Tax=Litorisediminicola beolgyonensis TaxID=1173614 RepID=A0ABW3ZH55_9RHOB